MEQEQEYIVFVNLEYQIEDSQKHMLERFNMIRRIHDKWLEEMGWDPILGWKRLEWKP